MTEQRCNYTGKYFLFLLGKLKSCIILAVILSLCLYISSAVLNSVEVWNGVAVKNMLYVLALVGGLGIFFLSFVTPLITMRHLYTRTSADNILSLPVTTVQRFFCEVGAALAAYAVPFIAFMPIALINDNAMSLYNGALGIGRSVFMKSWLVILFSLIMFSVFNIFLSAFCGRLAEAILYPLALNITVPLFFYLSVTLGRSNVLGLNWDYASYSPLTEILVGSTSPFGCFVYYVFAAPALWYAGVIKAIVLSAVFLALAFLVYAKRPAHNIGHTFVYRHAYVVNSMIIAIAATVGFIAFTRSMVNAFPTAYIILAVLLLILMLIMEFVNYKKINGIIKFILKYIGALGGGLLVSLALYHSQGFGEGLYVPSANECVYVRAYASNDSCDSYINFTLETDSELAEYIREQHRAVIDGLLSGSMESGERLSIEYGLKNGNIIRRMYYCTLPDDFFEKVLTSPEYRLSDLTHIDTMVKNKDYAGSGEGMIVGYGYIDEPDAVEVHDPYFYETEYFRTKIDWSKLRDALYKDIMNDTDYGRNGELPVCSLYIGNMKKGERYSDAGYVTEEYVMGTQPVTVYESYANTIQYLSGFGKMPDARERFENAVQSAEFLTLTRRADINELVDTGQTAQVFFQYPHRFTNVLESVLLTPEEFTELFKNYTNYTYTEGHDTLYTLSFSKPVFFDEDNNRTVEAYIVDQLAESGLLDSGKFSWSEELGGYTIAKNHPFTGRDDYMLNEQLSAELEKFFTDGSHYVYRYDRYTDRKDPGCFRYYEYGGDVYYTYTPDGSMVAVTTAIAVSPEYGMETAVTTKLPAAVAESADITTLTEP